MKIMLANQDRDFLRAYSALFEQHGDVAVTAFDGTQVLRGLPCGGFDLLILDRNLPRIDGKRLIAAAQSESVACITLDDGTDAGGSTFRLSYPFAPAELIALAEKAYNDKKGGKGNE